MLENDVIKLRALEAEDLDTLYRWENDTSLWKYGSTIAPFSRKLLWEYINTYDGDIFTAKQLRFMIILKSKAQPVGVIDICDFDPVNRRAAVGIMIDREFQRRGYGRDALNILSRYCHEKLGMHQLYATVSLDNAASLALFRGCDFKTCGRLQSWLRRGDSYLDVYLLQRLLTGKILKQN